MFLCQRDPSTVINFCPIPINSQMHFLDWIYLIWKYGNIYNNLYHSPIEKTLEIAYSIWTHRYKVIFNHFMLNQRIRSIWILIVLMN